MTERSTLIIEDDIATEVAVASAEPPTLLLADISDPRKSTDEPPAQFRAPSQRTIAYYLGIGIIGLSVGFLGASLVHEHSVSDELRQVSAAARAPDPPRHPTLGVHDDIDHAQRSSGSPEERAPTEHRPVSIANAADLLVQNRYGDALAAYRVLSELHRDQPVFSDVVSVLELKLGCGQADSERAPCD